MWIFLFWKIEEDLLLFWKKMIFFFQKKIFFFWMNKIFFFCLRPDEEDIPLLLEEEESAGPLGAPGCEGGLCSV